MGPPPSPATAMATPTPSIGRDVDAVALQGVQALESSDTAVDTDPNGTVRRAAAWLTPAFAAQVRSYPPVSAPGAEWNLWSSHRAYLAVSTSLGGDDRPAASGITAYRQVVAVLRPVGRDGWRGAPQTAVVFVDLALVGDVWRLSSEQST